MNTALEILMFFSFAILVAIFIRLVQIDSKLKKPSTGPQTPPRMPLGQNDRPAYTRPPHPPAPPREDQGTGKIDLNTKVWLMPDSVTVLMRHPQTGEFVPGKMVPADWVRQHSEADRRDMLDAIKRAAQIMADVNDPIRNGHVTDLNTYVEFSSVRKRLVSLVKRLDPAYYGMADGDKS